MDATQYMTQFAVATGSVVGIVSLLISLKSMIQGRKERRSEYLERLLKKFSENRVRELVCSFDSPDGASELFARMKEPGSEESRTIEEALTDIAHFCYLKQKKEITDNEFCFFRDPIEKVLSDPAVQRYIREDERTQGEEYIKGSRFRYLKEFIRENHLGAIGVSSEGSCPKECVARVESRSAVASELPSVVCQEIRESDFNRPTMIIKINRFYRHGMNDDEVFEKVRKAWRIRPENANKYEVVLAVASGIVRGVYLIDHWEPSPDPNDGGRYMFFRKSDPIEEKAEATRFLGKSVKGLFPQGASNPIRYYGGQG